MQPGESAGGAEAPGRTGQGGAPPMDGLEENDQRNNVREKPGSRRSAVAVFERLRARPATYGRG